ncbi:MAG: adenylate kinase family protein [Candidatus Aenigmatarchaeota archaeon]
MRIAITGTPGVGKTTVSKLLAKELNYKYISLNQIAKKTKAYIGYDKIMQSKIVDIKKIQKELKKIKGNYILDGHFSHEFDVDLIFILRCRPDILEKRLRKRYKKNKKKVQENIDAEILGVISAEVFYKNKKFYEIDVTGKKPKEIIKEIIEKIEKKNNYTSKVIFDWLSMGFEPKKV